VIPLVGIRAAITIPSISRVRATVRDAACLCKLRQIGMALNLNAQDERGQFPSYWNGIVSWRAQLR